MKDVEKLYVSLLYDIKRIKSYILNANRQFKRNKVINRLNKKHNNPYLITLTNRRAKLTSEISRGKFGSFCFLKEKYKFFVFVGCRGPPDFDFLIQENSKFGGKHMFNDQSPYTIWSEVINNVQHYFVSFVDGENIHRDTEVSLSVYLEMYKSIKKTRNLTRSDERHIEMSDLTEETLFNRALHPPKNVEEIVFDIERSKQLRAAIANLPETQRRRFVLHYDFGHTYEQIAAAEGCSFQSVGKSILLAKEKIKTFFKNRVEK